MVAGLSTDIVKVRIGNIADYLHGLPLLSGFFDVEDIDPFVCTHLVYGFAGLNHENLTIESTDPYNDLYDNWGKGAYDRLATLSYSAYFILIWVFLGLLKRS